MYDGVKYTVKRIEELLYEVRMAQLRLHAPHGESAPATSSWATVSSTSAKLSEAIAEAPRVLDVGTLAALHERYQKHDAVREEVIKRCREPQKVPITGGMSCRHLVPMQALCTHTYLMTTIRNATGYMPFWFAPMRRPLTGQTISFTNILIGL